MLLLPGSGERAVLLAGHLDTVGCTDFGAMESIARNPDALERRRPVGPAWLAGRGALDMKSGIAAATIALAGLAARPWRDRGGDVGLLVTVDEENLSVGIRACAGWRPLVDRRWKAVISTDFTDPPSAGFRGRAHFGTVGKLLAGVLLRTRTRHAGARSDSPDAAAWGSQLILRMGRLDSGRFAPPAVLRARENKSVYDTQVPDEFQIYFNVLAEPLSPRELLGSIRREIRGAWSDLQPVGPPPRVRLHALGPIRGARATAAPWDEAMRVADRKASLPPTAMVFFSPPYYASRPGAAGPAATRIRAVVRRHRLECAGSYPFISDLSFFGPAAEDRSRDFTRACPVAWGQAGIGLEAPLVTLGPWGRGAHQANEAVQKNYAFGVLPAVLEDCVNEIWK